MAALLIHKITIPEPFRRISNYQSVPISIYIVSFDIVTKIKSYVETDDEPVITIYSPSGGVVLSASMLLRATGNYYYPYKQDGTGEIGAYAASFYAEVNPAVIQSVKYHIFTTSAQLYT
jgi:hypothetical protein